MDDNGGYVLPKQDCWHVFESGFGDIKLPPVWDAACSVCSDSSESWFCVSCSKVFCSRYVQGHMAEHYNQTNGAHSVVISLVDLSVWCFSCDQYIKHRVFQRSLIQTEILKFGNSSLAHLLENKPFHPRTGFFYDPNHTFHFPSSSTAIQGLEAPSRIQLAYDDLTEYNILSECYSIKPRLINLHTQITREELEQVHSITLIEKLFNSVDDYDGDIYITKNTSTVVQTACAGVVDLSMKVMKGELRNGFALIRPPGHHCESNKRGGFCLVNNVAVAAASILDQFPESKILIVDCSVFRSLNFLRDVHHGNGVQEIFYSTTNVLYQSLHQIEPQADLFYPDEGLSKFSGSGLGEGFNINVPLSYSPNGYGDSDYVYIFQKLFIPIAKQYSPDIVLICAGFDSASGDPLGKFRVTPECFGYLTSLLMDIAKDGKVVLALEGGYNSKSVSDCVTSCMKALLSDESLSERELKWKEKIEIDVESDPIPQTLNAVKLATEIHTRWIGNGQ